MKKIKAYLHDVSMELNTKVSWPTWKELQGSAVVVMVASIITAILVFAMDFAFKKIMEIVYSILK